LVVGYDIGALRGDSLIDGHHHDFLGDGRLDDGVQADTIRRVEDDGIHALRDKPFEIGDLFGGATIAVDDDHFTDKAACFGFSFDGTDHLLAPAVADERVAHADDKVTLFG